jgi:hypothetical protein
MDENESGMEPIRCDDVTGLLDRRWDGRLTAAEASGLVTHLTACDACARRADLADWVSAQIRTGRRGAPTGFADRILARVAEGGAPRMRQAPPRPTWRSLAAAAAVFLVVGLAVSDRRPPVPQGPPQITVELELGEVAARSVAVAGDFNGWDAATMKQGADGIWRIRLSLPPGRYQYVFVVDDEKWIADPRSPTVVDSGFSGANSVLDVSL